MLRPPVYEQLSLVKHHYGCLLVCTIIDPGLQLIVLQYSIHNTIQNERGVIIQSQTSQIQTNTLRCLLIVSTKFSRFFFFLGGGGGFHLAGINFNYFHEPEGDFLILF